MLEQRAEGACYIYTSLGFVFLIASLGCLIFVCFFLSFSHHTLFVSLSLFLITPPHISLFLSLFCSMDQSISIFAQQGSAKLIEFNPIRASDVILPRGAVFVIANSCVEASKYVSAGSCYNKRYDSDTSHLSTFLLSVCLYVYILV